MAIGVDEVGRGSWAGPLLVVAAKQINELPAGLADSKILSKIKRAQLVSVIEESCELGKGWVEPDEIDSLGLTEAMKLGVSRALKELNAQKTDTIIIDGHINYCPTEYSNVRCIVGADASQPIVSAASIYAKVVRDNRMVELATSHPGYGFENHVGYGTKQHKLAISKNGICSLHRRSYKPIQEFL